MIFLLHRNCKNDVVTSIADRKLTLKVIMRTHRHTHTHAQSGPIAQFGPLKWCRWKPHATSEVHF